MESNAPSPDTSTSPLPQHGRRFRWNLPWLERLGLLFLLALVVVMLVLSWRRWPDAQVDFGRELYLPWRISQGAVLYRDLDHLFGPLSQYFNALVFWISGPGLMHLVYVNLAIYLLILGMSYTLVRFAWGAMAAFVASAAVICTLSFTQLIGVSNYNYACPYAHETTHGIALLLGMVLASVLWCRRQTLLRAAAIGLCAGLALLTKVEMIFAAACVGAAMAVLILLRQRSAQTRALPHLLVLLAGVLLPNLLATGAFALFAHVPLGRAWHMANSGWLVLFDHPQMASLVAVRSFLGIDRPGENAVTMATWSLAGAALVAALLWISSRVPRIEPPIARWLSAGGIVTIAVVAAVWVEWPLAGWLLPGALFAGLILAILLWRRQQWAMAILCTPQAASGILLWTLAAAMLARMALNPRLYHYGYNQAFVAMLVSVGILTSLLPHALNLTSLTRGVYRLAMVSLLAVMCISVTLISAEKLAQKTQPVGEGADLFYGFPADINPMPAVIETTRQKILETPGTQSLLVVPEGVMVNYLTRLPGTIPCYVLYLPLVFGESELLAEQVRTNPPSHVLLLSCDLRSYGINRFGDTEPEGQSLMLYLRRDYRKLLQIGGNPLDLRQAGSVLLERRARAEAPATQE